ncbi:Short-chain dehydrogenase srdC [Fulvia fulva]|uniref:Short-chain dehydrogenase srdC n=1 Tax=Passalora fulva TaxID=5499 RepID=A0A9Q8UT31_PASFU|nr:Short-chain dehydrogenase srdC [Fulvia fulva]KAK4613569.1 Short-chain dehydrogenase srdC [Fulvia fulva]KAK4614310.1 Short-chain dehydrogenase srdC [Fulvia fulva]UJO21413.1 Short-chain dehydrogenase srdC [Fulvia fulva]WPV19810.1 Short-chain dehydrogenase srdC [Fulvia fulva]WPV34996.1 Short-chain dehydrogenase srdC [Fulvia fulva]
MGLHFPGVAFVTGAGSGIGRATALLFAKEGCRRIAIADLNKHALVKVQSEIESEHADIKVEVHHIDLTSEESVDGAIKNVAKSFGRIDYACNAAGVLMPGPTDSVTVESFDMQQRVNLRGTWLCQRAEIKQMLTQEPLKADDSRFAARGSIANVASMLSFIAYDHLPAYTASKHAILGFTRTDGLRYAKDLIRVNAICPGVIRTPLLGQLPEETEGTVDKQVSGMVSEMAIGRFGLPEEVAECLVWATCGRASLVTGSTLSPNGGMVGA